VIKVLNALADDAITPSSARDWAAFVRYVFVGQREHPIRRLDIEYEERFEDPIVEAISRMTEIGDIVDGVLPRGEIIELISQFSDKAGGN